MIESRHGQAALSLEEKQQSSREALLCKKLGGDCCLPLCLVQPLDFPSFAFWDLRGSQIAVPLRLLGCSISLCCLCPGCRGECGQRGPSFLSTGGRELGCCSELKGRSSSDVAACSLGRHCSWEQRGDSIPPLGYLARSGGRGMSFCLSSSPELLCSCASQQVFKRSGQSAHLCLCRAMAPFVLGVASILLAELSPKHLNSHGAGNVPLVHSS